jgi:hypothetical protein
VNRVLAIINYVQRIFDPIVVERAPDQKNVLLIVLG